MSTNEIQYRLQYCETLQELAIFWNYAKCNITDLNKCYLTEVKEVMKEYLKNLEESIIEEKKLNDWWKSILNMSKTEKKRLNEFNIKKLKYYGVL